jgi:hypothetical protein
MSTPRFDTPPHTHIRTADMWLTLVLTYAMYQSLQAALRIQKALVNKQHVPKAAYQDVVEWMLVWCAYAVYTLVWETLLWVVYKRNNMLFALAETSAMCFLIAHRHELREALLAHETEMQALPALWQKHARTIIGHAWSIGQRWGGEMLVPQPAEAEPVVVPKQVNAPTVKRPEAKASDEPMPWPCPPPRRPLAE